MRIGYSYWGFLGDNKMDVDGNPVSAPDGNATYSWSLIWEMQRRGHTVIAMQEDRDWPAWKRFGKENFAAFSQEKRTSAYENIRQTFGSSEILPELDLLLVEWRFPIPGRNCDPDLEHFEKTGETKYSYDPFKHQPDWRRQWQILNHYVALGKTKVVLWDLDHKLTRQDEWDVGPTAILETSHSPLELSMKRTRVEPPTVVSELLEHPTLPADPTRKLVYIGSRYERDEVIDKWIKPVSIAYPGQVEFHGKWDDEAKARWPNIKFGERCTVKQFRSIYGTAGACPLLAKQSYLDSGFITPRVWEALQFGVIPVGLRGHKGIEQYTEHIAEDDNDLAELAELLANPNRNARDELRREAIEKIEFMDVKYFVDKLENL